MKSEVGSFVMLCIICLLKKDAREGANIVINLYSIGMKKGGSFLGSNFDAVYNNTWYNTMFPE